MAKPLKMSNLRFSINLSILVIVFLSLTEGSTPPKSKRQIYREQVLPSRGGKIPEAAFTSDRLALNRLNKEGIAIPDGVLLEHRHVHSHPHINQHDPEDEDSLIKIVQRPEDRYVAPPGKLHNSRPLTISSTYIIRKPIGPESTAIRTPFEQPPLHDINPHQENHIYQYYPETYTPSQKYVSIPQKYLPAATPTQGYLPVEVEQKHVSAPAQKYLPTNLVAPHASVVHHPHPYGYSPPVSYQQVQHSVAYYPVHVPLEIPNKDTLKENQYFGKSYGNTFGSLRDSEDIDSVVDWPYLLKQYTRLSDKINVLNHDSFGQSTPHSLFFTPEVLGTIDSGSNYYETRGRYARKSKEIAFVDSNPDLGGKAQSKTGRRLIKLKCTSGSENAVEDGSAQCYIRY